LGVIEIYAQNKNKKERKRKKERKKQKKKTKNNIRKFETNFFLLQRKGLEN
jgi:hypothetical protein